MPLRSFSKNLTLLALCVALVTSLWVYIGLGITVPFSCAFTSGNKASTQVKQAPACAVNRQEDWLAQSENQTLMTTNLLLVCPRVADVLRHHRETSFTRQLRNYIEFQLQQRADPRLEWIFFLKDHQMLFSHSPRSLAKFLHTAPTEISVLSFRYGSTQGALGLFAIRLDTWSVRFLDSVLQLLEQRPGLTETEAITLALASLYNARSVAYVPQWWLEVRSNCLERATWEAQFGVAFVVETDRLCCVSDSCQNALSYIAEQSSTAGPQIIDSQHPLTLDSQLSIEDIVKDFWTCVGNLDVNYNASPVDQLSEVSAAEERAAEECRRKFEKV